MGDVRMTWVVYARERLLASKGSFLIIALSALGLAAVMIILGSQYGVSVRDLTRDPAAVTGYPAYLGFISQFGILLWAASASACFVAYKVTQQRELIGSQGTSWTSTFFLCSGLWTSFLGFDDAFMVHDRVLPHFSVHESVFHVVYGASAFIYLAIFSRVILRSEFFLLLAALGLLFISVVTDLLFDPKYTPFWVEDGCKFTGIMCWFAYYYRTVSDTLSGKLDLGAPAHSAQLATPRRRYTDSIEAQVVMNRRKT